MTRWILGFALLAFSMNAHAYIDPNTGGLLFQLLAPLFILIAAAWAFLRRSAEHFGHKVLSFLRSLLKSKK